MAENEDIQEKPEDLNKDPNNIFNDSFFDALNEIDDGLNNTTFQKLNSENQDDINDIISEKNLNLNSEEKVKLNPRPLPVSKIPQTKVKETNEMNKPKSDPLNLANDDPNNAQWETIWEDMNRPDISDFKLMTLRLEPTVIKGIKINGYLETFHLPTSIPEIIEKIGQKYGGGKYQVRIVDGAGRYVKSKSFEISGLPKIPVPEASSENSQQSTQTQSVPPGPVVTSTPTSKVEDKNEDPDDYDDDPWDEEFDPSPRRRPTPRIRPMEPMYEDPYRMQTPIYNRPSLFKDTSKEKEVEEKISKLESKIDSKIDNISNLIQNVVNKGSGKSILDPDIVKALAPVVVTWLDSKGNKDSAHSSQFTDMNKQMVGLMQGMQDLVRISDKAKDDITEKERKEREVNRKEMLEYQTQMEQRFLDQQRHSEERHQQMIIQMRESLESKHSQAIEGEQRTRLDYEKIRQEFREKEEKSREEARIKEERLREDARMREENSRRAELEFREKMRQEETRFREELRQREEESRHRELEWKEELRQKELTALNDSKLRELEIMKQMREMDQTKTDMQQKLIEQIYSNNNNNRESQLHMELAIAKMTNDNESRMLQSNAEMQLEKIRHATQMQMAKMKHDLTAIESKKSDDPIDSAMQDFLKRKLQIDMIKELDMDVDEGALPNNNSLMTALTKYGPMLLQILMGSGGGHPMMPGQGQPGRVVNPNVPSGVNSQPIPDDVVFEDESEDVEEDSSEENNEEAEQEVVGPDLSNIDYMQEIPKVCEYFQFIKVAIESGSVTQEQAANEAAKLSPQIVDFLSNISDSKVVIEQLYPLLNSLGEDFANFFMQPASLEWMNKMLDIMNKKKNANTDTSKAASKAPKVEATKKAEVPKVETSKVEIPKTEPVVEQSVTPVEPTAPPAESKKKKQRQKANNV